MLAGRFGVLAAAGPALCRPGQCVGPGRGPGRANSVHRPASGGAGRRGTGARPGVRAHDLVGSVRRWRSSWPCPQGPSAQVREPRVETEFVFGRHAAAELSVAYAILVPQRRASIARAGQEGRPPHDERGDLREGLQCPAEEGRDDRVADWRRCASTPRRPGLTSRRSGSSTTRVIPGRRWSARPWRRCGTWPPRAAWTWCWCYSPDRLARKFAYQALLIEELARAGIRVEFVKGPRGDSPEDQLLVQFQGMFAEYEKAQLMERYRRGKAYRARTGSVNVLSGAPFGYRYVRKTRPVRRRLRGRRA